MHLCIVTVAFALATASGAHAADPLEWESPTRWQVVPLALAETAILLDGLQALDIKNHPGRTEGNPLLGPHPSDLRILALTGLAMGGVGAGWYALPPALRVGLTLGLFVV